MHMRAENLKWIVTAIFDRYISRICSSHTYVSLNTLTAFDDHTLPRTNLINNNNIKKKEC